jgi:hypothetical protein
MTSPPPRIAPAPRLSMSGHPTVGKAANDYGECRHRYEYLGDHLVTSFAGSLVASNARRLSLV